MIAPIHVSDEHTPQPIPPVDDDDDDDEKSKPGSGGGNIDPDDDEGGSDDDDDDDEDETQWALPLRRANVTRDRRRSSRANQRGRQLSDVLP